MERTKLIEELATEIKIAQGNGSSRHTEAAERILARLDALGLIGVSLVCVGKWMAG